MSRDVEEIYTRAIAKFADRSWYHKLARWYLRTRQSGALEKISRDAIGVFSGSELEHYFADVVQGHPDAALYLQLNLFAHDRFPEDLVFVHNLLSAYAKPETRDDAAAEKLLRQYWFYDPQLRSTLFERLSRQGRLTQELAAVRSGNDFATNPGALQFAMEAEAWLSHFEAAAPAARSLAAAFPGRRDFTAKASSLYRSLAAYDPRDTEIAVTLAGYGQRANPRDAALLANMGDIYADRELFARARTYWERMPGAQPGKPEAYLDTATVYWDYYRYDDALRWIAAARKRFNDPALYAYQAGAIYEGKRDSAAAVREYIAGALAGEHAAANRAAPIAQPSVHARPGGPRHAVRCRGAPHAGGGSRAHFGAGGTAAPAGSGNAAANPRGGRRHLRGTHHASGARAPPGLRPYRGTGRRTPGSHRQRPGRQDAADARTSPPAGIEEGYRGSGARGRHAVSRPSADPRRDSRSSRFSRAQSPARSRDRTAARCGRPRTHRSRRPVHAGGRADRDGGRPDRSRPYFARPSARGRSRARRISHGDGGHLSPRQRRSRLPRFSTRDHPAAEAVAAHSGAARRTDCRRAPQPGAGAGPSQRRCRRGGPIHRSAQQLSRRRGARQRGRRVRDGAWRGGAAGGVLSQDRDRSAARLSLARRARPHRNRHRRLRRGDRGLRTRR